MQNTMQATLQEFTILVTATNPDADFMAALSSTTGDFSLVLQVSPNDVIKSTGMIAIKSGTVTARDVGRAIEAAMSLPCSNLTFLHASPTCTFTVDGSVQTEFMPIGLPAKRLEVKIELVRVCDKMLPRWRDWAKALGRNMVGWRVEITSEDGD